MPRSLVCRSGLLALTAVYLALFTGCSSGQTGDSGLKFSIDGVLGGDAGVRAESSHVGESTDVATSVEALEQPEEHEDEQDPAGEDVEATEQDSGGSEQTSQPAAATTASDTSSAVDDPTESAAAGGACPFSVETPYAFGGQAYPFCQNSFSDFCPAELTSYSVWDPQTGAWVGADTDACSCSNSCFSATDCLAAEDGTAVPTCGADGMCALSCGNGEACPSGMQCVDRFGEAVCAWVTSEERCSAATLGITYGEDVCPFSDSGSGTPLEYDPDSAYPFCQWELDGGYQRCPVTSDEFGRVQGMYSWKNSGELCNGPDCEACICAVPCEAASDCALPETGDASPICEGQSCMLACDSETTCPDGMECSLMVETNVSVCAWITSGSRCSESDLQ